MKNERQSLELSHILHRHGESFLRENNLVPVQQKAFRDIINCRTEQLGANVSICNQCDYKQISYNSCRNRHCPKCQYIKQVQWVDKLKANLIQCPYYHIVFTLPRYLHKTIYINQKQAYSLMFKAASQAIKQCIENPSFLGAQYGAVAILHTWGQNLSYHPHIHMMVAAGGLSSDEMEWISPGKSFIVPVKALNSIYRAVFCKFLKKEINQRTIVLPDDIESTQTLFNHLFSKPWHVHIQKPFSTAEHVVDYLGKYTNRVAISNHRLKTDQNGYITFSYKDYKMGGIQKKMKLQANEFLKRFFKHILPSGFYKIRYYGILSLSVASAKRALCNELLDKTSYMPSMEGLPFWDIMNNLLAIDPTQCPNCKTGTLLKHKTIYADTG